jgi:multidrug resistance efflux pump
MRGVLRIRQARAPRAEDLPRVLQAEFRAITGRERAAQLRLARNVFLALLAAVSAGGVVWWRASRRVLVDGFVRASVVVAQAPARIRVTEVLVRPGERCLVGQPLVRLEALARDQERRALELAVEHARLRLLMAESGGELGQVDPARRHDELAEVQRRWVLASSEIAVAEADRVRQERRQANLTALRADLVGQHASEMAARQAERASLEARVRSAAARAELGLVEAERATRLHGEGLLSEQDAQRTQAASTVERETLADARAALESHDRLAQADAGRAALELTRVAGDLAELELEIVAAQERVESARTELDAWGRLAHEKREGGPLHEADLLELRELELAMLFSELEVARSRLATFDGACGNTTLVAECAGIVDRVHVRIGAVVEAGETLVSYYDPAQIEILAFAPPDACAGILVGDACRLVVRGRDGPFPARVVALGSALEPCPPDIPSDDGERALDLRRPIAIQPTARPEPGVFFPNERVAVVFEPETGPRASASVGPSR